MNKFIKNLNINKSTTASLILAGSIAFNMAGCGTVKDIKNNQNDDIIPMATVYTYENGEKIDVHRQAYTPLNNVKYTLYLGANMFYADDLGIMEVKNNDELTIVSALATNGEYTEVRLPNGDEVYVANGYLIRCPSLYEEEYIVLDKPMETYLIKDAYFYDQDGKYIGFLHEGDQCKINATNTEYSLVTLPNGTSGYVLEWSLMRNYQFVDGSAAIREGTPIYADKYLTEVVDVISVDEIIDVRFTTDKYAVISRQNDDRLLYTSTNLLESDFIVVVNDYNRPHVDCYKDYKLAETFLSKPGKDSSPTCTGVYKIVEKVPDWEFTTFRGSYANYWMPISNDTGQGLHDLIGDNVATYGTSDYHVNGSHGCIRISADGSRYIYYNYETNTLVFVYNNLTEGLKRVLRK